MSNATWYMHRYFSAVSKCFMDIVEERLDKARWVIFIGIVGKLTKWTEKSDKAA